MDSPELLAYSVESLIAEKFEAMIDLAEFNSRMKDFYDVYRILKAGHNSEKVLQRAIAETTSRRNTMLSDDHAIFSNSFVEDQRQQTQWQTFLQRANLNDKPPFSEVMNLIKEKLKPIYEQIKG